MDRLRRELPMEALHSQVFRRTRLKFLGRGSREPQPQSTQKLGHI
jgi:hypothetical protein